MKDEVGQWFTMTAQQQAGCGFGNHDKWTPPLSGVVKWNINANWRNAHLHRAWITRNHDGKLRTMQEMLSLNHLIE